MNPASGPSRATAVLALLAAASFTACKSSPTQAQADGGGLTGATEAASASPSVTATASPTTGPASVTLASGATVRLPTGVRKKDTSGRKLPGEISQMQVFTWPGGERLLSVSEMAKDTSATCDQLLDEQHKRMTKTQGDEARGESGFKMEDTKIGSRRVLYFSGKQQGIYGKAQGRPMAVVTTLTLCDEQSLLLLVHADKSAAGSPDARRVLFSIAASLRPAAK
jgi:hypothetical protein